MSESHILCPTPSADQNKLKLYTCTVWLFYGWLSFATVGLFPALFVQGNIASWVFTTKCYQDTPALWALTWVSTRVLRREESWLTQTFLVVQTEQQRRLTRRSHSSLIIILSGPWAQVCPPPSIYIIHQHIPELEWKNFSQENQFYISAWYLILNCCQRLWDLSQLLLRREWREVIPNDYV